MILFKVPEVFAGIQMGYEKKVEYCEKIRYISAQVTVLYYLRTRFNYYITLLTLGYY